MTIYNPHLLARQELVETFVARQPLLDELVDDLRRGGRQHHLLVGGRGSGKTTLLLRLATAIEDDKQLVKKCIPLRFPEEQYNVLRASDFWMNAIDALADAVEHHGDGTAAKRLEASLADLEPLDEADRSKRALALLEGWAKQTRRSILLLIDNLDLVLERLADSLWELREALSLDNRLILIGASSVFVEDVIDYQSPFYDFFRVHELGPLSEDDARAVVLSLAHRANTPKVAEVLERDPARFKALFVLTGGMPRTLALLHGVLALAQNDSIERDLDNLLDQVTPYYKARFDDLSSQSQVIVDKVALHWHPITAAECQAATHLDLNLVSAQLSRLVKSGVLTKVELPGPGKLGFQLSERFFNIWYLMRASRRLRRRLSWFVEFVRIFYGEEELRKRAEELIRAAPADSLSNPAKFLAFATAIPDEVLRRRLEFRAICLLADKGTTALRELMDLEGEDLHLAPVIDRVRTLHEIRARITSSTIRWPSGLTSRRVAEVIVRAPFVPIALKQHASRLIERATDGVADDLFNLVAEFERNSTLELAERLRAAISTGEAPSLCDVSTIDEVKQVVDLVESLPLAILLIVRGTELAPNPLPDSVFQQLLEWESSTAAAIIGTAQILIRKLDWNRARHLVLLVAQHASTTMRMEHLVLFLRECILAGLARHALELFSAAGLTERWAPLYEALRAAAEDNASQLDALAPEVRSIALALHAALRPHAHAPPADEAPETTPRSAKRKPATKRAASQGRPPGRSKRARPRGYP